MKKEMNSKAQVSIFIVLALIVVMVIIGIIYIPKNSTQTKLDNEFFQNIELKSEVNKVQSSILQCTEETSKQALEIIGLQGGYFISPDNSLNVDEISVPYYYYEGLIQRPSKNKIETELSNYVKVNLNSCLEKIDSVLELNYKTPKLRVGIKSDKVIFEFDSSIKIIKDKKHIIFELEQHPMIVPSALDDIFEVARYFTDAHEDDPKMYCISCLDKIAEEKNVYVDIIPIENFQTFVIISENYTSSEPYSFEFLNKHIGNEQSPEMGNRFLGEVPGVPVNE